MLLTACSPKETAPLRLREEEEVKIYSYLINRDYKKYIGDSSPILVFNQTIDGSFTDDETILRELSELSEDTLRNYREINEQVLIINSNLSIDKPFELISLDELYALDNTNPTWFRASTLTSFSRIGFNISFDQALVYVEHYCGGECATGDLYFLIIENDLWKIESILEGWVS